MAKTRYSSNVAAVARIKHMIIMYLAGNLDWSQPVILGCGRITESDVWCLIIDVINYDTGVTRW